LACRRRAGITAQLGDGHGQRGIGRRIHRVGLARRLGVFIGSLACQRQRRGMLLTARVVELGLQARHRRRQARNLELGLIQAGWLTGVGRDCARGGERRRLEHVLDQRRHVLVAARCRPAAHDHRHDALAVALHRGGEIEARSVDVTGLDAVHPIDIAEQPVVVAVGLPAVGERAQAEEPVHVRKVALNGQAERRHVARRGDLLGVRQTRGVAESGAGHAEFARLAGHALGEGRFAARQGFCDHRGHVVGRLGDQDLGGVLGADGLSGPEADLGRRAAGGMGRHREPGVAGDAPRLDVFEQEVEGHDLAERSRIAGGIGVARKHHLAALGIDDDGGEARIGLRWRGQLDHQQHCRHHAQDGVNR
jgi:hypothetical protein